MITSYMNNDEILKELVIDYKWVFKQTCRYKKKKAREYLKKGLCRAMDVDGGYLESPAHNVWFFLININTKMKNSGYVDHVCMAHSGRGTYDYYLLRGFRTPKHKMPYFVKATAHVVKRIKERTPAFKEFPAEMICCKLFRYQEIGESIEMIDDHLRGQLRRNYNIEESYDTMLLTHLGVFFAKREGLNYHLKTYLTHEMIHWEKESRALAYCVTNYIIMNEKIFSMKYANEASKVMVDCKEKLGIDISALIVPP